MVQLFLFSATLLPHVIKLQTGILLKLHTSPGLVLVMGACVFTSDLSAPPAFQFVYQEIKMCKLQEVLFDPLDSISLQ